MSSSLTHEVKRTIAALFPELAEEPLFSQNSDRTYTPRSDAKERAARCTACALHIGRKNSVFGEGSRQSEIAFVGDVPSAADNEAGKIFSDEAGALLDRMITAMNLRPNSVYKTNLLKCRPPQERAPQEKEIHTCRAYIEEEFENSGIRYVVALGETAGRFFSRSDASLSGIRGGWQDFGGIRVMITHHPRTLLKDQGKKKEAWEDLKLVMKELGK